MRSDADRIADMIDAIDRIDRYASRGRAAFDGDELIQTWVLHHLELLGEAARGVTEPTRRRFAGVPWARVVGMRNVLIHVYFGIDADAVWNTVEGDLPGLRRDLQAALDDLAGGA